MVTLKVHPYAGDYIGDWSVSDPLFIHDHWELVDEDMGSPDTADYVYSSTDKQSDLYFMEVYSITKLVTSAQLLIYARTAFSSQTLIPCVNIGGTTYDYPSVTVNNSWDTITVDATTKPAGGSWTVQEITTSKWGFRTFKPTDTITVATLQLNLEYNSYNSVPHAGI